MLAYKKGSRGEIVKEIQRALNLYPDGIYGVLTEERVKEWQKEHGLKADGVVGPATMAKLLPKAVHTAITPSKPYGYGAYYDLKKSRRRIDEIIIHCTATPEGRDYTVADIRRWHKQQGWSDIGYHYVIYRNGHIEEGRNIDIIGTHCQGHNSHSIGICYVGGCDAGGNKAKDTRTLAQKASLLGILTDMRKMYPKAKIVGHHDYEPRKDCPCFDAKKEYSRL